MTVKLLNNSQVCKSTKYEINIISFRLDMYKELVTVVMCHMYTCMKDPLGMVAPLRIVTVWIRQKVLKFLSGFPLDISAFLNF